MKKILCLTMVLFALVGCAKKELASTKNGSAESVSWDGSDYNFEEGASLTLWFDSEEYLEAIALKWAEDFPQIPLETDVVGSTDTHPKMILDGPAGLGPDVFIQPHDTIVTSYQDGILLPFGEYTSYIKENFLENSVQSAEMGNKLYGIPLSVENIALFYNKDFVQTPVQTWEEMIAYAQEFNNPSENKWAIRFSPNNSYLDYFFLTAYGFRLFGPTSNDSANPGWDSPEVIEGLRYFKSLRAIWDIPSVDGTEDFIETEFTNGTTPYVITGPWKIQEFKEAGLNFGVTKIPTFPGNKEPIVFSGSQIINVSSYTPYPNAARRLAKWLVEPEQLSILYEITGRLPALKDIESLPAVAADPYLIGIAEQAPFSYPMPSIPEMAFAWEPQRTLFEFVWDDALTPEEAVKKATEDFKVTMETSKSSE